MGGCTPKNRKVQLNKKRNIHYITIRKKSNMVSRHFTCKKIVKKHLAGRGGSKDVQKSLSLLERPSKTVGRFIVSFFSCVSTPPHTQVKNVTMSERRKRADAHPGFQKPAPLAQLVTKIQYTQDTSWKNLQKGSLKNRLPQKSRCGAPPVSQKFKCVEKTALLASTNDDNNRKLIPIVVIAQNYASKKDVLYIVHNMQGVPYKRT